MWDEKKNTENKKLVLFFSFYFNAVIFPSILATVADPSAEMSTVSILCWFVLNAAFTFNCEGFTCGLMHVLLHSAKLVKTAYKKCFNVKGKKPSCVFTLDTVGIPYCGHLH